VKVHRVLSISGGGIKGIAELVVLVEIEKRTGKSISELFSITTGTSIGAVIVALLTIPKDKGSSEPKYSAQEVLNIFIDAAPKIFPHNIPNFLGGSLIRGIKHYITNKFSQKPFADLLEQHICENILSDTISRLIIPVTDITNQKIEVFDSFVHGNICIKDILLATTAAPTYFRTTKIPEHNTNGVYSDGGLYANNPAYETIKILKRGHNRNTQLNILDKTMLCSIEFMVIQKSIPHNIFSGKLGWLTEGKIINKLITYQQQSNTEAVKCDLVNEGEFTHICLISEKSLSIDDSSTKNINQLIAIAQEYTKINNVQIQKLCDDLVSNLNQEQETIDHVESVIHAIENDSTVQHVIHTDHHNILDIVNYKTHHIAITRKFGQEFIKHLHDYYVIILGNVTIDRLIAKYDHLGEEGYTFLLEDLQLCCIKLGSIPLVEWLIQDEDFNPALLLNYAIDYYYESLVSNQVLEASKIKPIINNILTNIDKYWITQEEITAQHNFIMEYSNWIIREQILNYFDSTINIEYNHFNNNYDMSMEDNRVLMLGGPSSSVH